LPSSQSGLRVSSEPFTLYGVPIDVCVLLYLVVGRLISSDGHGLSRSVLEKTAPEADGDVPGLLGAPTTEGVTKRLSAQRQFI